VQATISICNHALVAVRRGSENAQLLLRERLLAKVRDRWDQRLIVVVAGAGLGKSSLLRQAIEENQLVPQGRDLTISCGPRDTDARYLGTRILRALEVDAAPETLDDAVDSVTEALLALAPTPVCLCCDDLHELNADSDGAHLIGRLIADAPRNTSFVIFTRTIPNVPVAALAARGEATVLTESELRFTNDELASFAALRAVDAADVSQSGGWPAVAELLASRPGVGPVEFAREQVLASMEPGARRVLAVLALLGAVDQQIIDHVLAEHVDLVHALADVPLVDHEGELVNVHALWHDALAREISFEDQRIFLRRAAAMIEDRGDVHGAVRYLANAQLEDDLVQLLRRQVLDMSPWKAPEASTWGALLPPAVRARPEGEVLDAFLTYATDFENGIGALMSAAKSAQQANDSELELLTLGWSFIASMQTSAPTPELDRVEELARAGVEGAAELVRIAKSMQLSMLAWPSADALQDEIKALQALFPKTSSASRTLVTWAIARLQFEAGAMKDSLESFQRANDPMLLTSGDALRVDLYTNGPGTFESTPAYEALPPTERQFAMCWDAYRAALAGRCELTEALLNRADEEPGATGRTWLIAMLYIAARTLAFVGSADEESARALVGPLFEVPMPELLTLAREAISYIYVLVPASREAFDALELRGVFAHGRDLARALVAAREQQDIAPAGALHWPPLGVIRGIMPPVLAAELACYASAAGGAPPPELLLESREAVLLGLKRAEATVPRAAPEATRARAALPRIAPNRLGVRVFGTVALTRDDDDERPPELRRDRVRALLVLLAVQRTIDRERATARLWPDLDDVAGARNLRVTLTHLQRALEPNRAREDEPFFLRTDDRRLTLVDDVTTDLDAFETAIHDALDAERRRAGLEALGAYERAIAFYGGELAAAADWEWIVEIRDRLRQRFVAAATRAAELQLARGEPEVALAHAERAIDADEHAERAYCAAADAQLAMDDEAGARRTVEHAERMLAELGVDPGEELASLRRVLDRR
jgi:DNA-binding SARP family transcriptional activator